MGEIMKLAMTAMAAMTILGAVGAVQAQPASNVTAAIADKDRPEWDTKRDQYYKPADVITAMDLKPGMKVADFITWEGYYPRIFSRILGPQGKLYTYYVTEEDGPRPRSGVYYWGDGNVISQPQVGAELSAYSNISVIHGPAAQFATPEPLDMIWIAMSYHDMHNQGLFKGQDVVAINKKMFAALKPGGTLVILDRAAKKGSGVMGARIDEDVVRKEVEAAGFQFVKESNVKRFPEDDYTKPVTKAQYSARADEFMFIFKKPQ
jgi:predicted methyltransferase